MESSSSSHRIRKICVLCGSSPGKSNVFKEAAIHVGNTLAKRKLHLVYGGGCMGLMGVVATTAHSQGSPCLGIIPKAFLRSNICGPTIGDQLSVATIPDRISHMLYHADAFIALPGGLGTLEEIFCIASWASLLVHKKPIGLLNVNGYFDSLLSFLDNAVENGFMFTVSRDIIISASTIEELLDKLQTSEYIPGKLLRQINWFEKEKDSEQQSPSIDLTLHL